MKCQETGFLGDHHQEFRLMFSRKAATDLFVCRYWQTEMVEELCSEAQLSKEQADLRTPFIEQGGGL